MDVPLDASQEVLDRAPLSHSTIEEP